MNNIPIYFCRTAFKIFKYLQITHTMNSQITLSKTRRSNKPRRKPKYRVSKVIWVMPLPAGGVDSSAYRITAPAMRVTLSYLSNVQINNAGFLSASKAYYPNGVYDVDPAFASSTVPGFSALIGLYNTWRVDEVTVTCNVSNVDDFPTEVCFAWFPNTTFVAANSFLQRYFSNMNTRVIILSSKGGQDRYHYRHVMPMAKLFGDVSTYYGSTNNFCGTGASNPTSLFTFVIGATPASATPFVNGVSMNCRFDFKMTFFDPADQLDI
jgi:hypothetical protein